MELILAVAAGALLLFLATRAVRKVSRNIFGGGGRQSLGSSGGQHVTVGNTEVGGVEYELADPGAPTAAPVAFVDKAGDRSFRSHGALVVDAGFGMPGAHFPETRSALRDAKERRAKKR